VRRGLLVLSGGPTSAHQSRVTARLPATALTVDNNRVVRELLSPVARTQSGRLAQPSTCSVASYHCLRVHARRCPLRYQRRLENIIRTVAARRYAKRNGRQQLEIGIRPQQPCRTTCSGRQQQRHLRRIRSGNGELFGDGKRPGPGSRHRLRIVLGVGEDMRQYGTIGVRAWKTERTKRTQGQLESETIATPSARKTTAGMSIYAPMSTTAELLRLQGLACVIVISNNVKLIVSRVPLLP